MHNDFPLKNRLASRRKTLPDLVILFGSRAWTRLWLLGAGPTQTIAASSPGSAPPLVFVCTLDELAERIIRVVFPKFVEFRLDPFKLALFQ